ncbi:beta-ketoacyl synthase chain length factor [Luteimonas viscosa]|uniref:Beta-ketoacyl synthase chain length factor n=1 Tax=Luteimonas viscosa TaxID=1132694 RepID=A0A5D4XSP3_9GAMM|nr:beta-ketoacyl synthase chain length factor [Luteimonas viscosa]TYT27599.1 beta-ketoacyl synthase chain length factor [Luteimonas viscosa]
MLSATIAGVGYWSDGLPDWAAARTFATGGALPQDPATRPAPQLLAPNERRRAPPSVLVALEVALAACRDAARDPAMLPSVFASTHGDLGIMDYMCETLARAPTEISPTKFHNSVHNAAAGYWTIGSGCMRTTTAISAYRATFAQGLLEALVQLATDAEAVLLVGYDTTASGLLSTTTRSEGLLGAALVLAREGAGPRLSARLHDGDAPAGSGPLALRAQANAMAPMLPLFDALAAGAHDAMLHAGPGRSLVLDIAHG